MSVEETDNELSYENVNNDIDDLLSDDFIYNMEMDEAPEEKKDTEEKDEVLE